MDIQKNKKKGREAMDILLGDVKQGLAKITLFIVLNTWYQVQGTRYLLKKIIGRGQLYPSDISLKISEIVFRLRKVEHSSSRKFFRFLCQHFLKMIQSG